LDKHGTEGLHQTDALPPRSPATGLHPKYPNNVPAIPRRILHMAYRLWPEAAFLIGHCQICKPELPAKSHML
jgi:hypothetical protein